MDIPAFKRLFAKQNVGFQEASVIDRIRDCKKRLKGACGVLGKTQEKESPYEELKNREEKAKVENDSSTDDTQRTSRSLRSNMRFRPLPPIPREVPYTALDNGYGGGAYETAISPGNLTGLWPWNCNDLSESVIKRVSDRPSMLKVFRSTFYGYSYTITEGRSMEIIDPIYEKDRDRIGKAALYIMSFASLRETGIFFIGVINSWDFFNGAVVFILSSNECVYMYAHRCLFKVANKLIGFVKRGFRDLNMHRSGILGPEAERQAAELGFKYQRNTGQSLQYWVKERESCFLRTVLSMEGSLDCNDQCRPQTIHRNDEDTEFFFRPLLTQDDVSAQTANYQLADVSVFASMAQYVIDDLRENGRAYNRHSESKYTIEQCMMYQEIRGFLICRIAAKILDADLYTTRAMFDTVDRCVCVSRADFRTHLRHVSQSTSTLLYWCLEYCRTQCIPLCDYTLIHNDIQAERLLYAQLSWAKLLNSWNPSHTVSQDTSKYRYLATIFYLDLYCV